MTVELEPSRPPASSPMPDSAARVVLAASFGNALEWYDLIVFGYFASDLAKLFFPPDRHEQALLLTFGTFGVSYLMRPLGAAVLGGYADRVGRKSALLLSIVLMTVGTAILCLMPSYATIGVFAPLGILAARLLQGFSVGGEFGSATAFMVEHGGNRRGFMASWQFTTQGLAMLGASLAGYGLTQILSADQIAHWGCRLPFAVGLLIGPAGLYVRRHVTETPAFLATSPSTAPVRGALLHHPARLALSAAVLALGTGGTYLSVYLPTYATAQLHLPASSAYLAGVLGSLVSISVTPVFGYWSDRVGRVGLMAVPALLLLASVYPAFVLLAGAPSLVALSLFSCWIVLLRASYAAPMPALMSELFPISIRSTGMSISYNIGVVLFGGFAPAIDEWLIEATGDKLAPSFYLMAMAAITLGALTTIRFGVALFE